MNITRVQTDLLRAVYKINKTTLKELEQYLADGGIINNNLTDVTKTFEQGYNNALEYVFDILNISPTMTIEELQRKFDYEFECNVTEEYKECGDYDEWGSAFVYFGKYCVEYNFCIDNSTKEAINCSAIYKVNIDDDMDNNCIDTNTYVHYEIDFEKPDWQEELENAMCKALIEFYNL